MTAQGARAATGSDAIAGGLLLPVPQAVVAEPDAIYRGPPPDEAALAGYLVGGRLPAAILDGGRVGSMPAGGYELSVERDRIRLASADATGAFYGVQTLRQILAAAEPSGALGCTLIRDWPDLPARGFMLDVSRSKVPTMETLRELVELLGRLKLNQLQLYTEHTFAYKGHEEVWKGTSPITASELRELDDLCGSRAIELVANQNSFGHMRPWLTLPRYRHLAEAPDGFEDPWGNRRDYPYSLSPVEPATLAFLDDLYSQLLPNVRSGKFNVGCDETFDLGQGRSGDLCRSKGKGAVYLDYLTAIHRLVRRHGKQMQFYADIVQQHPDTIPLLPADAIAVEWGYEAGHPFDEHCRRLAEAKLEYYVAPGTSSWNSFTGRWGVARENIAASLEAAARWGASGMLLTEWGDNGYLQPFVTMLPGLVYAAAGAWNRSSLLCEPWSWLSLHFFREPAEGGQAGGGPGPLAAALRLLSELYRLYPGHIPNASVFGVILLLFDLPMYGQYLEAFDSGSRRKVREVLREVSALLARSSRNRAREEAAAPGVKPAPRAATRTAAAGKQAGAAGNSDGALFARELEFCRGLVELALDVAEGASPPDLHARVARLEEEHRLLWLRRYRPGGLELSRSFLRKRVDSLG